jgi:putative ABC transport system permease protein
MKTLHRKLFRDLRHLRTQALAISLVIACGVATFVMSISTAASLLDAKEKFYREGRFADVFLQLKRAPLALEARLAEIPGVARTATRVVAEVKLDLPDMSEPAQARLISLPDSGAAELNVPWLRRGRLPESGRRGEVLVSEAFAEAHRFRPGDRFHAVINGRREALTITGIALSPEYVYQIRPGEILPDEKRYGILWMPRRELAAAYGMEGAFNDAAFTLQRGQSLSAVLREIDRLTAPWGGLGAYSREDQISNRFVSDELSQLKAMASIPPAIFLLVAAFLLNMVIARIIGTQREQIAVLKAFGYTNREVVRHYLGFAAVITLGGIVIGTGAGAWMGRGMTRMYIRFFRFPEFTWHADPAVLLAAAGLASLAAAAGVIFAVRRVAVLAPAEAMRPEPPQRFRPSWLERTRTVQRLPQAARMILRRLQRQPVKSSLSIAGVALSVAVLVLGSFSQDIIHFIVRFQFQTTQRQDAMVALTEPGGSEALASLRATPGILHAEPFRGVAVRLVSGHRSRLTSVTGLERGDGLMRLVDMAGDVKELPPEGLVLSESLSELLEVKPGDSVTMEVLEGSRPSVTATVRALLRDFSGTSAWMDLTALNRLLQEGAKVSGAFVTMDGAQQQRVFRELKDMPAVSGVNLKSAAVESFQRTMSENLLRMRVFNIAFAAIIAFGVVYNTARIALSERQRELATLRVLGFTRREVSWMLLGETGVLILAALLPGLLLGHGLAALAVMALETRTQRFPLVIEPATYGYAVLVVVVASLLSALVVRHRIDRLDLVEVLKSRE